MMTSFLASIVGNYTKYPNKGSSSKKPVRAEKDYTLVRVETDYRLCNPFHHLFVANSTLYFIHLRNNNSFVNQDGD